MPATYFANLNSIFQFSNDFTNEKRFDELKDESEVLDFFTNSRSPIIVNVKKTSRGYVAWMISSNGKYAYCNSVITFGYKGHGPRFFEKCLKLVDPNGNYDFVFGGGKFYRDNEKVDLTVIVN